jgi:hypothetical protein
MVPLLLLLILLVLLFGFNFSDWVIVAVLGIAVIPLVIVFIRAPGPGESLEEIEFHKSLQREYSRRRLRELDREDMRRKALGYND